MHITDEQLRVVTGRCLPSRGMVVAGAARLRRSSGGTLRAAGGSGRTGLSAPRGSDRLSQEVHSPAPAPLAASSSHPGASFKLAATRVLARLRRPQQRPFDSGSRSFTFGTGQQHAGGARAVWAEPSSGEGDSSGFRRYHVLQRGCLEPLSAAGRAAASAAPGGNSCKPGPRLQPERASLRSQRRLAGPLCPLDAQCSAGGSPSEQRQAGGGSTGGSTSGGRVPAAAAA